MGESGGECANSNKKCWRMATLYQKQPFKVGLKSVDLLSQ
jgi:hypothetical protein